MSDFQGKIDFTSGNINIFDENINRISNGEYLAGSLANEPIQFAVKVLVIIIHPGNMHQPFNREFRQFNKKAELLYAADGTGVNAPNLVLHEAAGLQCLNIALGVNGQTLATG